MEFTPIAHAVSPRGDVVLRSRREPGCEPVLELRANGIFVMDTASTATEVALATAALEAAGAVTEVLIGGLGLGFTLQAVLADPRVGAVSVVEIEPALIEWLRDGTVAHGPALLGDPRVTVINDDLAAAVAATSSSYDVVLLDVDNGPGYVVHDANLALYRAPFLRRCHEILHPGGVLAIWSADRAPELAAALAGSFGAVDERPLPVNLQTRQDTYWLYLATRPAS